MQGRSSAARLPSCAQLRLPCSPGLLRQQWTLLAATASTSTSVSTACASSSSAGPRAHFASSSDKDSAAAPSTSSSSPPAAHAGSPAPPRWDWRWVLGKKLGRKPAIKRPARHQWHYCNPNYDPHHPLPPKMMTPYTPPTNLQQDEWQVFRSLRHGHRQPSEERYRQQFVRWLALRDLDWRDAFFEGIAADAKKRGKEGRRRMEALRQKAWAEFVQTQLLEGAGVSKAEGGADSGKSDGAAHR